ncbi:hypothetical protein YC2023_084561 [Brassica napus]
MHTMFNLHCSTLFPNIQVTQSLPNIIIGGALLSKLDLPENGSPKGKKNGVAALYDLYLSWKHMLSDYK